MDCRFIKNKNLCNILEKRLKEQLERLNRDAKEPYETNREFPFEISEKEVHIVKIYSILSQSIRSQYYLLTLVTFPKDTKLDEMLDILSTEDSESGFEISESKLISCANEIFSSRYLLTKSITSRLPKSFEYQSSDRIFNIIPSQGLSLHSYACFEQKREEKVEYVYFDATNCVLHQELPLFAIKERIFQNIPIENEEGTCQKIFRNIINLFSLAKNKFKHPKLE